VTARRKLTITSFSVLSAGNSKNGPWALHDVACVDEAGEPVDAKLKTFHDPEAEQLIGNLIEYEVERQDDERYGISYLLVKPGTSKPKRGAGSGSSSGLKGSVDDLRARVERLEAQVAELAAGGARAADTSSGPIPRSESPATGPDVGPTSVGHRRDPHEEYQF
jgi:hypothetical protein